MSLSQIQQQKLVQLQQEYIQSQTLLIKILEDAVKRQRQNRLDLDEVDDLD